MQMTGIRNELETTSGTMDEGRCVIESTNLVDSFRRPPDQQYVC